MSLLLRFALWIFHINYHSEGLLDYAIGTDKHYPRMMIYTEDEDTRNKLRGFIDKIGVDNPKWHKVVK